VFNEVFLGFTACDQLNFAGPSIVSNETDKLTILGCNLKAAKRAMAMADFKLAEYLFSHCVLFLPVNHWEDDYDLSLELFDLAAKCAVVTTNTSSLQHFAAEVARHAKCFNDKLEVSYCVMTSLVTESKIPAALEYGLAILTQLNEPIRSDCLAREISYTNSLIKGMSEADFLNHKLMEDKTKLITMKYIAKLELLSFMVRPELHPFITMKLVQLTCLHGR
jgi:predicted ATPase